MKHQLKTVVLILSLILPASAFAQSGSSCVAKDTAGKAIALKSVSTFAFQTMDGKYTFVVTPGGSVDGDCSFELDLNGTVVETDSLFTTHDSSGVVCSGDSMDSLNVITNGQRLESLSCHFSEPSTSLTTSATSR